MTYEEFLEALEQTPRDWYLEREWGLIRRWDAGAGVSCCPVSSLRNASSFRFFEVAEELGLKHSVRTAVMDAADNDAGRPAIRADLLRACGLTEQIR